MTTPEQLQTTSYILAALTASGGIMGYARTGSLPSIIAGCSVGALYGFGGYRLQHRQPYGVEIALLASLILAGSAYPRALKTRKPVPILLSVISTFGLYTFGKAVSKNL